MKKLTMVGVTGGVISLICLMALITTTQRSRASLQFQQADVRVMNMTKAFQVVSTTRDGNIVRLSFRNGYQQAVNGFTLAGGPNSGVQVDLIRNDNEIAPGAVYDYRVFASNLEPSGSPLKTLKLTILNVVFEDGTGDGDKQSIEFVINRRLGEKAVLDRMVPLFDSILVTLNLESPQGMRQLKDRMLAEVEVLESEQPSLGIGIHHGKSRLLKDLDELENNRKSSSAVNLRDELVRIKQRYEKELVKLQRVRGSSSN